MDHPRPSLRLPADAGGRLLDDALAKRQDDAKEQKGQTYRQHLTAVYDAWCGLKDVHAGLIARVAGRYGLSVDRVLRSSLLCVALHDVGKLSHNFQRMMRARDDAAYKAAVGLNYRHEVAALWLVAKAAGDLIKQAGPMPGRGRLEVLAVAGHHKYLADEYLISEDKFSQELSWEPDALSAIEAARGLARAMFLAQGWEFPVKEPMRPEVTREVSHDPFSGVNRPFEWLKKSRDALLQDESTRGGHLRDLFVLLKGLLMTADWMASGAKDEDNDLDAARGVVRVPQADLRDHLRERVERRRVDRPNLELQPFGGYTKVQSDCAAADGHVIAVAPTGCGKTEASWLWALGQVERGHVRKVIILLPTMVTANSIHDRLVAFFGAHGHEVGLVHSTADLVRKEIESGEDEADSADVRADHLGETHLFRPVTVGTVDQLLVPLFHAGRWAMKTMAAADAAIVIDEVHAYEPHTLGLVVLMIEQLAPLGARFMVMSATLPEALRTRLTEALTPSASGAPGVEPIGDTDLINSARNTWETEETPLTRWLLRADGHGRSVPSPEFLGLWGRRNERGETLKLLIVVNTVRRCQDLAKALREFEFDLVCYHSKFIFDDRRTKERRLNEQPPRLVVATQVVEVSLDIDYDVLLTECAPIDALVQRAGRVNRARRTAALGRVVIHPAEEGSENIYGRPEGLLEATWRCCLALDPDSPPTEGDLVARVEEVYGGLPREDDDDFRRIRFAVKGHQAVLGGVLDSPRPDESVALLRTRKDDYPQVSVIPERFAEAARMCRPGERKRYELKVPVWYARKHRVATDDLPICPMVYDSEFGAELLSAEGQADPNQMIF